jgi:hypothetical protein
VDFVKQHFAKVGNIENVKQSSEALRELHTHTWQPNKIVSSFFKHVVCKCEQPPILICKMVKREALEISFDCHFQSVSHSTQTA